jgi:hypothetical protein
VHARTQFGRIFEGRVAAESDARPLGLPAGRIVNSTA